jgi:hypothetical protein
MFAAGAILLFFILLFFLGIIFLGISRGVITLDHPCRRAILLPLHQRNGRLHHCLRSSFNHFCVSSGNNPAQYHIKRQAEKIISLGFLSCFLSKHATLHQNYSYRHLNNHLGSVSSTIDTTFHSLVTRV